MYVHSGFIEATFKSLSQKINHEVMTLSGIVALSRSVWSFCVFISLNHFRAKKLNKISNKIMPAITDRTAASQSEDSPRN